MSPDMHMQFIIITIASATHVVKTHKQAVPAELEMQQQTFAEDMQLCRLFLFFIEGINSFQLCISCFGKGKQY